MLTQTKTKLVSLSSQTPASPAGGAKDQFYPQLNGLRFVFIFMVMIHHWGPQTLFEQYRIGWVGVDLFYVLSGFLIGEILLRERDVTENRPRSIRNFVIRRILRIFPLYYAVVLLYSFFVDDGGILVYNLTYTNNIYQAFHLENVKEDFWHLWSLCVEEQFYLLFPFLVFFVNRKWFLRILIAGICFSFMGRILTTHVAAITDLHVLMPFCLDSLFMGVLLAYLKLYRPAFLLRILGSQTRALAMVSASVAALLVLCYFNNDITLFGFLRLFGSAGGFYLIGFSVTQGYRGPVQKFLENPVIASFGKISYGLYLIHSFVERIYYRHVDGNVVRNFLIDLHKPVLSNRYVIDFVLLFTITVAISYLSFYFFERRFLKLKTFFT